ncbi:MAG: hypothetical protein QOD77_1962 [Thermoplasmata archaeon]|jgi:hypothetical protein|nr:hypothetical protein [Thermoplasmata archaeon]
MNNNASRILALALATAVAAILVAPAGTAQADVEPQLNLQKVTPAKAGPLIPNVDTVKFTVSGTFTYQQTGSFVGGPLVPSVLMQYTQPTCPSAPGITITGALATAIDVSGATPQKTSFPFDSEFTVSASQLAPGETDILCTWKGKVLANGLPGFTETPEQSISTTIKVRFLGLLSASVPATIQEGGPQKEITYELQLTNLGNSLTNVNFDLANAETVPEGWSPVPPTPIIMQSKQQGGTEFTAKVPFTIQTPHSNGWNNDETTFQLKITPSSVNNPEDKGNTIAVNVLARVRGIYVPGPEPFLLVAAVLGAALVARLARKD